jgi:hypothetical protein
MNWSQKRLALLVALLLVTSAALFAVGVAIEKSEHHEENTALSPVGESGETSHADESGEQAGEANASESHASGETTAERQSEKIAVIDPESWPLVGLAIAASLALAAGVYWRRGRWLLAAVGFGILFAAADAREVVYQLDESNTTVATIAATLVALHLLVALVAAVALTRRSDDAAPRVSTA